MKNSQSSSILLGLLAVAALMALVVSVIYVANARELRTLQGRIQLQMNGIQNNRNFIGVLAGDLIEYSKTHQDIDPILESAGIKQGKGSPAPAAAPATNNKPAGK
jgi:hypothetical protein